VVRSRGAVFLLPVPQFLSKRPTTQKGGGSPQPSSAVLLAKKAALAQKPHGESLLRYGFLMYASWSLGWISSVDSQGRTIWIADAHRGDGKRFVVRADEKLTAFMELEAAIRDRYPTR
jgi:hypothetical protein